MSARETTLKIADENGWEPRVLMDGLMVLVRDGTCVTVHLTASGGLSRASRKHPNEDVTSINAGVIGLFRELREPK